MTADRTRRGATSRLSGPKDVLAVVVGMLLLWFLVRPGPDAEPRPPAADGSARPDTTVPPTSPEAPPHSRNPVARFRRFYGAHPLHLLVLVASVSLTAYAVSYVVQGPDVVRIAIWFVAAVIAHDLVLFPLYALADRSVTAMLGWRTGRQKSFPVSALNYIRLPVLASGLLLLVYFPAMIRQGEATYVRASGLHEGTMYLDRWLLLTGAFFLISAVVYALRARGGTDQAMPRPTRLGRSPAAS